MNLRQLTVVLILALAVSAARTSAPAPPAAGADRRIALQEALLAQHLLSKVEASKGLCAVLGCGDAKLVLALVRSSGLLVHVIEPNGATVAAARKALDIDGLYGTRVIVEQGRFDRLPYADNLLDAVVAVSLSDQTLGNVPLPEVLRVLRPRGKAIIGRAKLRGGGREGLSAARLEKWVRAVKTERASAGADAFGLWAEIVKPVPEGIDDWTHWQHGPDNNPFSSDRVIKAPYMTQFLALPYYSTMPSISVIAGGRMFRAAGHMAIHEREERYLNTLYATNVYNGALLWTRPLPTGFLVHRSLMLATPEGLYLMEPKQCLLLDPETGAEKESIVLPQQANGDEYWQWMALKDGVLYVLLGGPEKPAEVIKRKRPTGAWGWDELSQGYYEGQYPWGYGRTIVALNPRTKESVWTYRSETPIDSRALCMSDGRLFVHSEGHYVACLDTRTGDERWKNDDAGLLAAIAEPHDQGLGFKTTPYAICTPDGLYFGGRGRRNVVGVSAQDGRLLWALPGAYNATNLLFYDGHLYAHIPSCTMLDPLTGQALKDLHIAKRSCSRLTGCPDCFFHRGSINGGEGTTRYVLASDQPTVIHAFRPACNDGIIPAQGLLHVTPWDCDCNLQLMGSLALCPAGGFEFNRPATDAERLQAGADVAQVAAFSESPLDWPTYRGNNRRSSSTAVTIPVSVAARWQYKPEAPFAPTPPTVAGGLVFVGGKDGKVRALDGPTGKQRWRFYTAGPVRLPPTIWRGRAYVGSGDGYVYALEAATGRLLWRFRAAPVERRIPVFGSLCSTWPVNGGVVVGDGVAYAAAGIINYDGTHVYALDALSGKTKWQNNTSGHLNKDLREGVSVQGDLAIAGGRLWLAGGNVVSPGAYDLSDGRCLNAPPDAGWPAATRGSEVCGFLGKYVMLGGRRLFTLDDDAITNWQPFEVYSTDQVGQKLAAGLPGRVPPAYGNGVVALAARSGPLLCVAETLVDEWIAKQGKGVQLAGRWKADSIRSSVSIVIAANAVVAVGEVGQGTQQATGWSAQAFDIQDGHRLWEVPLPGPPLPGGLALAKDGQALVVLEDGKVLCLDKGS